MTTSLPAKPSLEHLRKQAKHVHQAHSRKDSSCCAVLRNLRQFNEKSDQEILAAEVTLSEAQFAVAIEYGFKDWKALKHYFDASFKEVAIPAQPRPVEWEAHLAVRPLTRERIPDIGRFLLRIKAKMRPAQADGTLAGAQFYVERLLNYEAKNPFLHIGMEASSVVYDTRTNDVIAVCMLGGLGFYDYYVDPAYDYGTMLTKMFAHASNVVAAHAEEIRAAGGVPALAVWREDDEPDADLFMKLGFTPTGKLDEEPVNRVGALGWHSLWTTLIGCIKGCMEFLGSDITSPWLFGGTGHAFFMNFGLTCCPSHPTAWRMEGHYRLLSNLGATVQRLSGHKESIAADKRAAWDAIRKAIDEGYPCYGWNLEVPEYYVINGYDKTGYYYVGCTAADGKGPKDWTKQDWLEMCILRPSPRKDDLTVVKEAIEYALALNRQPDRFTQDQRLTGLMGYDNWVSALAQLPTSKDSGHGLAFNLQVWLECRNHAVAFLDEAAGRLPQAAQQALADAHGRYREVAQALNAAAQLFPWDPGNWDKRARDTAIIKEVAANIRTARAAEEHGLAALERLHATL